MSVGTLYRGGEGMWTWVLHRITGVSVFFFLLVHVLDTALVRVSPEAYDLVIATYKTPIATGANWTKGQDVIVGLSLTDEQAKAKFGKIDVKLPYLRTTADPS